ncbi:secreted frizzled-related protein 2 [Pholidichthys leucotaenia]
MTTLFCSHFTSRGSSHSASLLCLLLLAGPDSPLVLGYGTVRAGQDGRVKAEGRARSGIKDKGRDWDDIANSSKIGFGASYVSNPGVAEEEEHDGQEDPSTLNFKSTLSITEDELWESHSSSHCVPIPESMALCQNIGYTTMRMPNLLGHESPAEAVQQSASWLSLLARECHPDARIFLCSLFAPICLDRFISPCRSLCESVKDSCAPIMRCYGYPWPEILQCDQYPADHVMCISSVTSTTVNTGWRTGSKPTNHKDVRNTCQDLIICLAFSVPQASCQDCKLEEASSSKETLETFCKSDFVVKLRLTRLKYSPGSLSQFSLAAKLVVLKDKPLLNGQIRSHLELWLERDATCVGNMTRQHTRGGTFLVMGTVQGGHLVVNKAYVWQKRDKDLMAAVRKWKHHQCRN